MTNDQRIIAGACLAEAGTGLGLIASPWVIVELLLGVRPEDTAIVISRVAGIALLGLAVACWPGKGGADNAKSYLAMLLYNALVTVVLAMVALGGEMRGTLLWPVVVLHFLLSVLLTRALLGMRPPA